MLRSSDNRFITASAGSGKTTFLVTEALSRPRNKIGILTYTNNNINEIKKKFYEKHGGIPPGVDVVTWFSFLLSECARPYQRSVYAKRRIRAICFQQGHSARYARHSDTERYYFRDGDEIYSDKISRFAIDCEETTNGRATRRLSDIYDEILIDEFQDFAGWDLDLLELFLRAGIRITATGDPRQCTYSTNDAAKNSQYRGIGVLDLVNKWKDDGLCQMESHARSYRCSQKICDFADALWPDLENTESQNTTNTDHDGMFIVSGDNVHEYVKTFSPVVLRYDRRTKTYGYPAQNFGYVKGATFERVLIVPHGSIKRYLRSGNLDDVRGSLEKLYVGVTRARHSVAFVYDGACSVGCVRWP